MPSGAFAQNKKWKPCVKRQIQNAEKPSKSRKKQRIQKTTRPEKTKINCTYARKTKICPTSRTAQSISQPTPQEDARKTLFYNRKKTFPNRQKKTRKINATEKPIGRLNNKRKTIHRKPPLPPLGIRRKPQDLPQAILRGA